MNRKEEILRMVTEIDERFLSNVIDYLYVLTKDVYEECKPVINELNRLDKEGK